MPFRGDSEVELACQELVRAKEAKAAEASDGIPYRSWAKSIRRVKAGWLVLPCRRILDLAFILFLNFAPCAEYRRS